MNTIDYMPYFLTYCECVEFIKADCGRDFAYIKALGMEINRPRLNAVIAYRRSSKAANDLADLLGMVKYVEYLDDFKIPEKEHRRFLNCVAHIYSQIVVIVADLNRALADPLKEIQAHIYLKDFLEKCKLNSNMVEALHTVEYILLRNKYTPHLGSEVVKLSNETAKISIQYKQEIPLISYQTGLYARYIYRFLTEENKF